MADADGNGWRLFSDRHPHARLIHHGGMRLGHLNITVTDVDTATLFYGRWFGFDRVLGEYPDGTRFLTDASGFELGLHKGGREAEQSPDWHFGFLASSAGAVRDLMSALSSAGVTVMDEAETEGYTGFKLLDPDGYMIEVYWEPRN